MDRTRELGKALRLARARGGRGGVGRAVVARLVLTALALTLVAAPARAATTLEQVVQHHLDWLGKTNNYLAELRVKGMAAPLGTVFVDNTKSPREVSYQGDVAIGSRSRHLVITGTRSASRAALDGTKATAWNLPQGPFGSSFDLFSRGVGVQETIDRINTMASEVSVLDNPVGHLVGIKMIMNPGFLGQMDAFLDSVLLGSSIPRNIESTLWFSTTTGRLERMVLQEGQPDMVVTALKYLETNVSQARSRALVPKIDATRAKAYPSLVDMMKSVAADEGGSAN